jgi:hypothetical protein
MIYALVISLILNLVFMATIAKLQDDIKRQIDHNNEISKEFNFIPTPDNSIPTADDARFLRNQVRSPSWKKVYRTINQAISNGEDHCEIHLYSYKDPSIPKEELVEELEGFGYKVNFEIEDGRWFTVWWKNKK